MPDTATESPEALVFTCPWGGTGRVAGDAQQTVAPAPCRDQTFADGDALIAHLLEAHGGPRGWTRASAEREVATQGQAWADLHAPDPVPFDYSAPHFRVVTDIPAEDHESDRVLERDVYATREEAIKAFVLDCAARIGYGEVLIDLHPTLVLAGHDDPEHVGGVSAAFASGVGIEIETCVCGGAECASA